jgi:hypothetical protein
MAKIVTGVIVPRASQGMLHWCSSDEGVMELMQMPWKNSGVRAHFTEKC